MAMSDTKIDRRAARDIAAARRNDGLIERAAKRADWAGAALESAAGDLDGACGTEGNALTGLAEVVLDEAARVSHLAEDIGSQRPDSDDRENRTRTPRIVRVRRDAPAKRLV
jgi:hypothetical protein